MFDQILGDLERPKFASLWDHSVPGTPLPMSPRRSPIDDKSLIRPKVATPEPVIRSKAIPVMRRCDSDDYGLRKSPSSPKPESRLAARFSERRFSDSTNPLSPGSASPVQTRKRFNFNPGSPSSTSRKGSSADAADMKYSAKPFTVVKGYEKRISLGKEVINDGGETLKVVPNRLFFTFSEKQSLYHVISKMTGTQRSLSVLRTGDILYVLRELITNNLIVG